MRPKAVLPCLLVLLAACAANVGDDEIDREFTEADQQAWDSQAHNPTHATHSYLTEVALGGVAARHPEAWAYRYFVLLGANTELHELPVDDPDLERLRLEVEGTNGACRHPERLWTRTRAAYQVGNKVGAYFLLGLMLHYVEDMGVPAHALGVIHQGTWSEHDNFELMGLMKWAPDFGLDRGRPWLTAPDAFVGFSAQWTRDDFATAFPGETYRRDFFPSTWLFARKKYTTFVKQREGRSAVAAYWALDTALVLFDAR